MSLRLSEDYRFAQLGIVEQDMMSLSNEVLMATTQVRTTYSVFTP